MGSRNGFVLSGLRRRVSCLTAGHVAGGAALVGLLVGCSSSPESAELPYVDEEPVTVEEEVVVVTPDESDDRRVALDGLVMTGDFGSNTAEEPSVAGCGFVVDTEGFDLAAGEDELVLTVVGSPGTAQESVVKATVVPGAADSNPALVIDHRPSGEIAAQMGSEADNRDDADRQLLVMVGTPDQAEDEQGHHFRLDASVESDTSPYRRSVSFWVQSTCAEPPPPIPTGAPVDPVGDAGVFDDPTDG